MPVTLKLHPATRDETRFAIEHWHYSRRVPAGRLAAWSVFEDGRFIGVVAFGGGAAKNAGKPYKLARPEVTELVRVALDRHETPVTRIVAIALKLLKREHPHLKAVVSYADPTQGHEGSIYVAGGWTRDGTGGAANIYFDRRGESKHDRGVKALHLGEDGIRKAFDVRPVQPKHKFVKFLDRKAEERWRSMQTRAGSATGGTAPTQGEGPGSSPRPAHPPEPHRDGEEVSR